MATSVKISQAQYEQIVARRVDTAQDKEAARSTLVKMAVSLTDGQSVRSGYLRMIKEGDGLKLGTSLWGDRAEKQQARDVVRALVRNAYGEHPGVEAEIERYLQVRDQKIGTQSFVRLVQTLDRLADSPAAPTPDDQRLAAARPKQNTNLRGERVEVSVQLSRALDTVDREIEQASAALCQNRAPDKLALRQDQAQAARQAHQSLIRQQTDGALPRSAAVNDALTRLERQAVKLENLIELLKEKTALHEQLFFMSGPADRCATLPQPQVHRLRQQLDQAEKMHAQFSQGIMRELPQAQAIEAQQVLGRPLQEKADRVAHHEQQRERINGWVEQQKFTEAADLILKLDPGLTSGEARERLLPGGSNPAQAEKMSEHLARASLQAGHAKAAVGFFRQAHGLKMPYGPSALLSKYASTAVLSAGNQKKLEAGFAMGARWIEALDHPEQQLAFFSALSAAEQLGVLNQLTSADTRATLFASLTFADLPALAARLEALLPDELVIALHRIGDPVEMKKLCAALSPPRLAQVLANVSVHKLDPRYAALVQDASNPEKAGKSILSLDDRRALFSSLNRDQQLALLKPDSGLTPQTRQSLFKALGDRQKTQILEALTQDFKYASAEDAGDELFELAQMCAASGTDGPRLARALLAKLTGADQRVDLFRAASQDSDTQPAAWLFQQLEPTQQSEVLIALLDDEDYDSEYLAELMPRDPVATLALFRPQAQDNKGLLDKLRATDSLLYSKVALSILRARDDAWKSDGGWQLRGEALRLENAAHLKTFESVGDHFSSYVDKLDEKGKSQLLDLLNKDLLPGTGEDFSASDLQSEQFLEQLTRKFESLSAASRKALDLKIEEAENFQKLAQSKGLPFEPALQRLFSRVWCRHLAAAFVSGHEDEVLNIAPSGSEIFRSKYNRIFETSPKTSVLARGDFLRAIVQVCDNIRQAPVKPASEGIYIGLHSTLAQPGPGHALGATITDQGDGSLLVKLYDPNLTNAHKELTVRWDDEGDTVIELPNDTLCFRDRQDIQLGIDSLFAGYLQDNPVISLHFKPDSEVSLSADDPLAAWNQPLAFDRFKDVVKEIFRTGRLDALKALKAQALPWTSAQNVEAQKFLKEAYDPDAGAWRLDRTPRWDPRDRMKADLSLADYDRLQALTGLNKNFKVDQALSATQTALSQAQPADMNLLTRAQALLENMQLERADFVQELRDWVGQLAAA